MERLKKFLGRNPTEEEMDLLLNDYIGNHMAVMAIARDIIKQEIGREPTNEELKDICAAARIGDQLTTQKLKQLCLRSEKSRDELAKEVGV